MYGVINMRDKKQNIKTRTLELYNSLPQNYDERVKHIEVRDECIELNMPLWRYIAKNKFVNNHYIEMEDKIQSVIMCYCQSWWWYKWEGHYRTDLGFATFYVPRISEMIGREFDEVKYSVRRRLCMEVAGQLGKKWSEVRYEDIDLVDLPSKKEQALRATFGTLYPCSLDEFAELYNPADECVNFDLINDEYESYDVKELIIQELLYKERPLNAADLNRMSQSYGVDYYELTANYAAAYEELRTRLHDVQSIRDEFTPY